MNAVVVYELEQVNVDIRRVYTGEGNPRHLYELFRSEVVMEIGVCPPVPGATTPAEVAQLALNKRAIWGQRMSRKAFAEWLMEKHGWQEAEDVHGLPE